MPPIKGTQIMNIDQANFNHLFFSKVKASKSGARIIKIKAIQNRYAKLGVSNSIISMI